MINYLKKTVFLYVFIGFLNAYAGVYEDFFRAIHRDDVATVAQLIQRGADPNWPNESGMPALHLAIQLENKATPVYLAKLPQTKPTTLNRHGETALMLAAIQNRLDVAQALVERGAEVNQPGWTALHYAATRGHREMIRFLLDQSAYIDAEAPNGNTPLMMAAQFAPPLTSKLLLEEGADPNLRNNLGRSALDLSLLRENQQAAFYIRAFLEAWEVNERAQSEGAPSE